MKHVRGESSCGAGLAMGIALILHGIIFAN